jgi:hypothetical protein
MQARIKDEYDRMEKKLKLMEAHLIRRSKSTEAAASKRPADSKTAGVAQNGAYPVK